MDNLKFQKVITQKYILINEQMEDQVKLLIQEKENIFSQNRLFKQKATKQGKTEAQVLSELLAEIPAGRMGKPEEFGATVAFLCSDSAAYINGINLPVDGGRLGCL